MTTLVAWNEAEDLDAHSVVLADRALGGFDGGAIHAASRSTVSPP